MFDFTCMTRSENAALVREHNGSRLLLGLVGDCLVEVRVSPAAPPHIPTSLSLQDALVAMYFPSLSASHPNCPVHPILGQTPSSGMFLGGYPLLQPHRRSGAGSGWRSSPAPPQTQLCWLGRRQPPILSMSVLPPLPLSSPAKPGSSQPPPSCPDQPCNSSCKLCLSLCSPSGHWAPGWPGASSPPLMQRGWCGGGRLGHPRWRCWLRGECPHPAGLGLEHVRMVAVMPAPVPCTQGEHLPAPFADIPRQHQQEHQSVQHRPGHALPQHQPAGHQSQPGTWAGPAMGQPASPASLAGRVTLIYPVPSPQRV